MFSRWISLKRCFPRDQDKSTAFLERDVGGAGDQVVAEADPDGAQRLHAARADDHAVGAERATGDARGKITGTVGVRGQRPDLRRRCSRSPSLIVARAQSLRTRCVSTSSSRRTSNSRIPSAAPVAPVIANHQSHRFIPFSATLIRLRRRWIRAPRTRSRESSQVTVADALRPHRISTTDVRNA